MRIAIAKIVSTSLSGGYRFVKALLWGKSGVVNVNEVSPYGLDSNPVDGGDCVYVTTTTGVPAVVGYFNKGQIADKGEIRIYSTKESTASVIKFYIHLKNDGTCEMGGVADNMVRYTPLDSGLQDMVTRINSNFATLYGALGITPVPPVTLDISASKINEIKTL